MEIQSNENSEQEVISSNDISHRCDDPDPDVSNNGDVESMCEASEEEVRGILEVIASTGKFWHEWDKLKHMLAFQLKQVLSEYPEAKMSDEQQKVSLAETYPDLLKRLNQALFSFIEGPPFTLQRLCEILLNPRSIYLSLSKLALALEKNLLVASTLSICTDPYPPTVMQSQIEPEKDKEEPPPPPPPTPPLVQSNLVENGAGDQDEIMAEVDEIMAEVEAAEIDDNVTVDMETFEEIVGSPDANPVPTSSPPGNAFDQRNDT